MNNKERIAFDQGYVCAVATLVSAHDQPTMAKDILRANPPDDWSYIDDYDKDILRKAGLIPKEADHA